jgi:MFS family permease
VFAAAAFLGLGAAALFALLARVMPAHGATARPDGAARNLIGPARLVLASGARPFLVMVALGACVFTTMTSYQATLAASRGLNPSIFYASCTAGVIIPRFTVTRLLARTSPATATTVLLAGMCLSLAGFLVAGHDPAGYAASSALLGVTYGLAYPLIQAQAADRAPDRFRQWALWYFSLAYFAGIYGFPLIAGAIIVADGYQALIACLLSIAALELALSIKTQHARQRAPGRPARRPAYPASMTSGTRRTGRDDDEFRLRSQAELTPNRGGKRCVS